MRSKSRCRDHNSGHIPDYGAIFMANNRTREECFSRLLFGLPSNFTDFVLQIKEGMLLFLYDYDDKNLHGVFEATSDGALNIVPNAYKSSGMMFPAQVRFRILRRCTPLPGHVFRDAIKENLYTPHKFHSGLSKHQARSGPLLPPPPVKLPTVRALVKDFVIGYFSKDGGGGVVTFFSCVSVQSLLFLFEEQKPKIERLCITARPRLRNRQDMSRVSESHPRLITKSKSLKRNDDSHNTTSSNITSTNYSERVQDLCESKQVPDLCRLDQSETMPVILPTKPASVVVCDPEMTADLEDYIPLPSVDPAEFQDPMLDTFQWDTNSAKSQSGPEACEPPLKPKFCSVGTENSNDSDIVKQIGNNEKDKEEVGNARRSCRRGLYSDSKEMGLSVFLRLAGMPKVTANKRDCSSEFVKDTLNRLDRKHEMRQSGCTKRAAMGKSSKASKSVFSRLGSNLGNKGSLGERASGSEIRSLDKATDLSRQNLKRKVSSDLEAHNVGKHVKGVDSSRKQHKRVKSKEKHLNISREMSGNCSHSDLSVGSPASTVDSESNVAFCKSSSTVGTSASFIVKGAHPTEPFTSEIEERHTSVSVQDEAEFPNLVQPSKTCQVDPVAVLLAQYQDYLSKFSEKDQSDISTDIGNNVILKSGAADDGERPLDRSSQLTFVL